METEKMQEWYGGENKKDWHYRETPEKYQGRPVGYDHRWIRYPLPRATDYKYVAELDVRATQDARFPYDIHSILISKTVYESSSKLRTPEAWTFDFSIIAKAVEICRRVHLKDIQPEYWENMEADGQPDFHQSIKATVPFLTAKLKIRAKDTHKIYITNFATLMKSGWLQPIRGLDKEVKEMLSKQWKWNGVGRGHLQFVLPLEYWVVGDWTEDGKSEAILDAITTKKAKQDAKQLKLFN